MRDLPARAFHRVRCHRDYSPRNWLWDERHGLGVIDFEHARPDVAGTDVARLHDGPWVARPELEVAFWAGYGRVPDADERAAHDVVRAVQAFATVLWARQHDDAGFEAEGRAALERLAVPT